MVDSLRNNPIAIRSCILYEVLQGRKIETVYRNLCAVIGRDAIEYNDFQYWYYRFLNGSRDLEYDRNLDPKTRSLLELPAHTVGEIVDKLELKDQLILRKVSRGLRTIVDMQKPGCNSIELKVTKKTACLRFDNDHIHFKKVDGVVGLTMKYKSRVKKIEETIPLKAALNELNSIMKHPKFQLKKFEVRFSVSCRDYRINRLSERWNEDIETSFNSVNHEIHVEEVVLSVIEPELFLTFLPYLKPGKLQSMDLNFEEFGENPEAIQRIYELEQWKQAKNLKMSKMNLAPVGRFQHFERISLSLNSITTENVLQIKNVLLQSTNLQYCRLRAVLRDEQPIKRALDEHFSIDFSHPNRYFYRIPTTKQFYEIQTSQGFLGLFEIRIERKFKI